MPPKTSAGKPRRRTSDAAADPITERDDFLPDDLRRRDEADTPDSLTPDEETALEPDGGVPDHPIHDEPMDDMDSEDYEDLIDEAEGGGLDRRRDRST
jgi:hypothetical protein